ITGLFPPTRGRVVEIFEFFRWTLATVVTVTVVWPLNVPLAALAYKVRRGQQPIPEELEGFWTRCTFAALGLAVLSLAAAGIDYGLAAGAQVPAGPVHILVVMVYLPAATWFMFVMFALEDLMQGLSVFLLYVALPGLPLLLIDRALGLWHPLAPAASWLL